MLYTSLLGGIACSDGKIPNFLSYVSALIPRKWCDLTEPWCTCFARSLSWPQSVRSEDLRLKVLQLEQRQGLLLAVLETLIRSRGYVDR